MNNRYKYPNGNKVFELVEIDGYKYKFKCGHWCTDSVFRDLINIKTNLANWQINQIF